MTAEPTSRHTIERAGRFELAHAEAEGYVLVTYDRQGGVQHICTHVDLHDLAAIGEAAGDEVAR